MAVGCSTHYYRVTDPESGKTYYTNKIDRVSKFLLSITVEQLDETKLRDHIKEAA
jgi:hypothetical protein